MVCEAAVENLNSFFTTQSLNMALCVWNPDSCRPLCIGFLNHLMVIFLWFTPTGPLWAVYRSCSHHGSRDRPQLRHDSRPRWLLCGGHCWAGRLCDGCCHWVSHASVVTYTCVTILSYTRGSKWHINLVSWKRYWNLIFIKHKNINISSFYYNNHSFLISTFACLLVVSLLY